MSDTARQQSKLKLSESFRLAFGDVESGSANKKAAPPKKGGAA